ncbi:prenylcysteine oxidase-like [Pristis pectinata]|uniref:prenylcysteine oxidase-like n=1 Tax=Pristis pectinata TaxID=685728 RepID=UPI00223D901D|nr:prenylcysteine oxidase-like [Pristis pectinata]
MVKFRELNLFFLVVWLGRAVTETPNAEIPPPERIAVIGAGIGGAAAAHFLRQYFGRDVQIDVYESGTVGGRLAKATISGQDHEIGAATIHPLSLHIKEFVQLLGLKERKHPNNLLAVYDGEQFVFEESEWFIINFFKLIWRYGFDFLRVKMWLENYQHKFMRIYQYQAQGYSFTTMEKLLQVLGGDNFVQMTKHSIDEALQEVGISQRFIDEMVGSIIRLTYGEGVNVNAFVGMTSLSETESDLWTVEEGNQLICSGLLYSAKVNLIKGKVTSVDAKERPRRNGEVVTVYEVNYLVGPHTDYGAYDIVIVAAPIQSSDPEIHFRAFSQPIDVPRGRYQQKFVTLVEGRLNASFFSYHGAGPFRPTTIGTTVHSGNFILGASVSAPVTRGTPPARVWKVLSPEPLGEEGLRHLFPSYAAVRQAQWLAHPRYSPDDRVPPFVLHDQLYHLNAIEWAASTLEMMAIAAKNGALLAHHRWFRQLDKIDQDTLQEVKVEL